MPTGITAGILDGEITTFEQFVKRSVRAMGVAMHMRDEPSDMEYKERIPSDYYKEEYEKYCTELEKIKKLTDEELLTEHNTNMTSYIEDYKGYIKEKKVNLIVLKKMLAQIQEWKPPTTEHNGFKDFMIEQINSTIKYDGDPTYYKKSLNKLEKELEKDMSAAELREEKMADVENSIARYKKSHEEEIEGCTSANKWIKDLYGSLNDTVIISEDKITT